MAEENELTWDMFLHNNTNGSLNGTFYPIDNFNNVAARVVAVLFALITAFGFLGNTLVIIVVIMNKTMRTSTYMLVLNLAIADLFFIIICVPFTAVKYNLSWQFGDTWCRMVMYMTYVCAWASVYTLVLMCVDRLFAIVFAIRFPNIRSKRNVSLAIAIMWIGVSLANIPAWMYHGTKPYEHLGENLTTCLFQNDIVDEFSLRMFNFSYFVFGFMLPVVVIIILYSVLVAFLMKRPAPGSVSMQAKTNRKVTVMVITVVSVFIICWLPIHVILVMANIGTLPQEKTSISIQIAANCLAYMNSCMNPVLYTISSTVFRKAFKDFLSCHGACKLKLPFKKSDNSSSGVAKNVDTQSTACDDSVELEPMLESRNGQKQEG